MKIIGIGIDIVENERVRKVKYFDRVAEYICTPEELKALPLSRDAAQFVASHLATKEAIIKAFPHEVTYRDINLTHTNKGLHVDLAHTESHSYDVQVSIAHEFKFTISNAIVSKSV